MELKKSFLFVEQSGLPSIHVLPSKQCAYSISKKSPLPIIGRHVCIYTCLVLFFSFSEGFHDFTGDWADGLNPMVRGRRSQRGGQGEDHLGREGPRDPR